MRYYTVRNSALPADMERSARIFDPYILHRPTQRVTTSTRVALLLQRASAHGCTRHDKPVQLLNGQTHDATRAQPCTDKLARAPCAGPDSGEHVDGLGQEGLHTLSLMYRPARRKKKKE